MSFTLSGLVKTSEERESLSETAEPSEDERQLWVSREKDQYFSILEAYGKNVRQHESQLAKL